MIKSGGFALVLVLWVLSLLTIMAGSFALSMRREAAIVTGSSGNAQAYAVAESGLAVAELMLMNTDLRQRWRTDGSIYQIDYTESKVRVQMLSESGKVDINSADQTLLQGLMLHAPIEAKLQTKLVNAILDWRDADDLVRIEGAEKEEYKDAGLNYRPRNKPFQSIEELQLVLGMNEQVFNWLESLVTVYSGQPTVDLTQASKEVLLALPGMDTELIDGYIAARRESAINGLPAPAFGASAGTGDQPVAPTNSSETAVNSGTEQKGAVTVVTEALLDDGTTAMIKALIKISDSAAAGSSPFQALKWQRSVVVDASLFTDEKDQLLVRQYAEPEFNN
ncbi:MAG TPA: type II secretion system protein GspK [Methylobacter sp.]|jgi:general secretion pathway protein K